MVYTIYLIIILYRSNPNQRLNPNPNSPPYSILALPPPTVSLHCPPYSILALPFLTSRTRKKSSGGSRAAARSGVSWP